MDISTAERLPDLASGDQVDRELGWLLWHEHEVGPPNEHPTYMYHILTLKQFAYLKNLKMHHQDGASGEVAVVGDGMTRSPPPGFSRHWNAENVVAPSFGGTQTASSTSSSSSSGPKMTNTLEETRLILRPKKTKGSVAAGREDTAYFSGYYFSSSFDFKKEQHLTWNFVKQDFTTAADIVLGENTNSNMKEQRPKDQQLQQQPALVQLQP
ncbi:unnamed protein product, partial [Amoebophrya sp. A25]|eukprot:GSA25T00003971001.1